MITFLKCNNSNICPTFDVRYTTNKNLNSVDCTLYTFRHLLLPYNNSMIDGIIKEFRTHYMHQILECEVYERLYSELQR